MIMENNKYFDQLKNKPDYVVKYQEDGTLNGSTTNANIYNIPLFGVEPFNTFYGWAASKSHPENPTRYIVNVDVNNHKHNFNEFIDTNIKVYIFNLSGLANTDYKGKHDLFLYMKKNDAILAGKQMAIIDERDNMESDPYYNTRREFETTYNGVKNFFSTIFNGTQYEKYYKDAVKQVDKVVKKYTSDETINKAKECAKECADKVKEYAQNAKKAYDESWDLSKLIDELNKFEVNNSKHEFWCELEQCAIYRELTKDWAVNIKHTKNENKSKYSVTIFNLSLGSNKCYTITKEEFHNIVEILNETADGRLKFNSIMDILQPYVDSRNDEDKKACKCEDSACKCHENKNQEPKKKYPIQFCQFRPDDEVPSEIRPGKAKFNVGDLVRIKSMGVVGTVEDVVNIMNNEKTRKLYSVVYGINTRGSFWSYELDKA